MRKSGLHFTTLMDMLHSRKNLGIDLSELSPLPTEGEFLGGKISHPPSDLFDLSMYYYSFFKSRKQKCCQKVFLEAYEEIYISTDYYFDNIEKNNRRLSNCYFKAFVKKNVPLSKMTVRKRTN